MKDEFIEYGGDIHPIEAEFFKELMLLCAKYGVKLKPNMFSDSDSTCCKTELDYKKLNILQLNLNLKILVLLMIILILMHHVTMDFKI